MIRTRFLARLAATAVLVVAGTAVSAGAANANETSSIVVAPTADGPSSLPPGVVPANGGVKIAPGGGPSAQAWACVYGYPCLYDGDNGTGDGVVLNGCGFWDLNGYRNWANSALTYGNSITVYNWTGSAWVNWGTVPAWQQWNFELKNQIDGVNVNC
ncbi:hypothetical protein [Micromonospora sp. NPDC047074]|uniref:hypothetical protein n=1 Tax=Micromonospora sp. NPDC047074 TaxID=3154339 RepID=UPI0033EF48C6